MYKPICFLHAAALSLTSVMAMEMDAPEETTGGNHLPTELQQQIIDQLPGVNAVKVACVSRQWHEFVNDDPAWKNRIQNDFQEFLAQPIEGESWQEVYKKLTELSENWRIVGDFSKILPSRRNQSFLNNRRLYVIPQDQDNSQIEAIQILGYEEGRISICFSSVQEDPKIVAELQKAGLLSGETPVQLSEGGYRCTDKNRFAKFLAVFVKVDFIPPLLARAILHNINVSTTDEENSPQ
ncbi:F-box protein [Candidatus Odyssella thessalonicensis]|uniref:F-box protein n=1 Tax=Candidatus Odyssella thessalonicensis TaxID=84647 RepID=UPI000225B701|nr:F-box protein [Candidatus Odyssella thessalonicensis]